MTFIEVLNSQDTFSTYKDSTFFVKDGCLHISRTDARGGAVYAPGEWKKVLWGEG